MQHRTDLFVLCAYKLKLQHVLQLSPVYEKKLLRFIAQTFTYALLVSKVTLKRSHQTNRYSSRLFNHVFRCKYYYTASMSSTFFVY